MVRAKTPLPINSEDSSISSDENDEPSDTEDSSKKIQSKANKTPKKTKSTTKSNEEALVSESDIAEKLIDQLLKLLPKDDTVIYTTSIRQINWNQIQIENHSADDLKALLKRLLSKIRKLRSLTELLQDARASMNDPILPTKPPASYTLYLKEKYHDLKKKYDGKVPSDLYKKVASSYSKLSPEEREIYVKRAQDLMDTYKEEVIRFEMDHPELKYAKPKPLKGKSKEKKPFQAFMEKNRSSFHPGLLGAPEAKAAYAKLPIEEKVHYIKKYLKQDDLRLFTDLPATDRQAYLEYLGAPKKTGGGFGIFLAKHIGEFSHIPKTVDRWKEVSKLWKALTEDQRNKYRKRSAKKKVEYQSAWKHFVESLDEFDRKLIAPTKRELNRIKRLRLERENPGVAQKNAKEKAKTLKQKKVAEKPTRASSVSIKSEKEEAEESAQFESQQERISPLQNLFEELDTVKKSKKRQREDNEDSLIPTKKKFKIGPSLILDELNDTNKKSPKKKEKVQLVTNSNVELELSSQDMLDTTPRKKKKKKQQLESEDEPQILELHSSTKSPMKKKNVNITEPLVENEAIFKSPKKSKQVEDTEDHVSSLKLHEQPATTPSKKKKDKVNGNIGTPPPPSTTVLTDDAKKKKKQMKIEEIVIPEPDLPPANVFTYYCYRKFGGNKELARIKWKKLKASKKEKYETEYSATQKAYAEELKNYLLTLGDEDRIAYKKKAKALQKQNFKNAINSDSECDSD